MDESSTTQNITEGAKTTAIGLVSGGLTTAAGYGMYYVHQQLNINYNAASNFYNEPCGGSLHVTYGGGYSCPNAAYARPYHQTPNCTGYASEICTSLLISGAVFIPSIFVLGAGAVGLAYSGYKVVKTTVNCVSEYFTQSNDDEYEDNTVESGGNIQSSAPNENSRLVPPKDSYSICERFAIWNAQRKAVNQANQSVKIPGDSVYAKERPPGL